MTKQIQLLKNFFNLFYNIIKKNSEEPMRGSKFVSDSIDLLYYHLQNIGLKRSGSYIDSPEWLKNKATINKNDNDDNCFQYALTVALTHQNIENNPQRISKIEPFIHKHNCKGIYFPSHSKDWKKFDQSNKTIALNILFVLHNIKQIRLAYISTQNFKRNNNKLILLMITGGTKQQYLAVKRLSA